MNPSDLHPNKKPHNWLAYYCHDRSLKKYSNHVSGRVYDLGAGSCCYRQWCLDQADAYISVDWPGSVHAGSIDISTDLNGRLPIRDAAADSIICFSVLEHLHEPKIMLSEAARILRSGGFMLLQVPWQWWIHEEPADYYRYTPYMLRRALSDAGFEEAHIEAQGGFFIMIALKVNYFSLRLIKGPKYLRSAIRALLWIPWQITQVLALALDKLDYHPQLETHAYFVVARRSCSSKPVPGEGVPSVTVAD